MKIKYKEKILKFNLFYGMLMIVIGILWVANDSSSFKNYLWIIVGALQTGSYFYDKKFQYLSIENNKLTRHFLIPRSIEIEKIKKIWRFRNSYKIETDKKSLRISKNLIEEDSLFQLDQFFETLNLNVREKYK